MRHEKTEQSQSNMFQCFVMDLKVVEDEMKASEVCLHECKQCAISVKVRALGTIHRT